MDENFKETTNKLYINYLRKTRNELLSDSDKYMFLDYPITEEQRNNMKDYRQKLRDYMGLPEIVNYNLDIPIPDFPKFPL